MACCIHSPCTTYAAYSAFYRLLRVARREVQSWWLLVSIMPCNVGCPTRTIHTYEYLVEGGRRAVGDGYRVHRTRCLRVCDKPCLRPRAARLLRLRKLPDAGRGASHLRPRP